MVENLITYESATGKELALHEFFPDPAPTPEAPARAGMVIVHGLGDYVRRYTEAAQQIAELGIAVVGIDLPGHGQSAGRRGVVGRMSDVHVVIDEARAHLRSIIDPVGGKLGALAHSTGGMMLFDYLTRFPGNFAFGWVNAMLVRPLHRHEERRRVARLGALVAPSLTVSTKVVPSMGREGDPDEYPPPEEGKGHDRVSLRFGMELLRAERRIHELRGNLKKNLRLLMTHGGRDEVCPVRFARDYYAGLDLPNKEFREFPEHLHHTLHDPQVMAFGLDWLRRVLEPVPPAARA